jgi:hypothetical protein
MENIHRTEATVIGIAYGNEVRAESGTITLWDYDENMTPASIANAMHIKYGTWFDELYVLTSENTVNGIVLAPKIRHFQIGIDYRTK